MSLQAEELAQQCQEMDTFLVSNIPEEKHAKMKTATTAAVVEFLQAQYPSDSSSLRPLAVVTSGGTSVPLEQRAVRSITNFSSGGRGAAMTEYLLRRGYNVILVQKEGSLRPFHRVLEQKKVQLLDLVNAEGGIDTTAAEGLAGVDVAALSREYRQLRPQMLTITFDSVVEYLGQLKIVLETTNTWLAAAGEGKLSDVKRLLVLAAAVSDYFMPLSRMAAHKISGGNGLTLDLDCVPKGLGVIASGWCNSSSTSQHEQPPRRWFVVSFKLETDPTVLEDKATKNLTKYQGMNAVVANLLHSYKQRVDVFTLLAAEGEDGRGGLKTETITTTTGAGDIEAPLVDYLCAIST